MNKARGLALAAAIAAGVAGLSTQAMAEYVRLGFVEVSPHTDRSSRWDRFGGHMEGLRLTADRSDIYCRSIRVLYGNGRSENLYSGGLREDRPIYVDLAGGARYVKRIDFVCRSRERRGGKIYVMADVGRYRDEWRRSAHWRDHWSHVFQWDHRPAPAPEHPWVVMSQERFTGRHDRERSYGGWAGHSVDTIVLKPIDNDAYCTRGVVIFMNGERQNLHMGGIGRLERGGKYRFDLHGRKRNIRHLNLVCRALGDYDVTIAVMVRK